MVLLLIFHLRVCSNLDQFHSNLCSSGGSESALELVFVLGKIRPPFVPDGFLVQSVVKDPVL